MKRAFISYSIENRNLHLITLLLEHLRKNDYVISVSNMDSDTESNEIINADIFIGIITIDSKINKYVIGECQFARKNNIPFVLVVENGVKIPSDIQGLSVIGFDRSNPQDAIDKLLRITKPTATTLPKKKDEDYSLTNLLIGGIAIFAGIAAFISLLSEDK
jgi:hypothetical protein